MKITKKELNELVTRALGTFGDKQGRYNEADEHDVEGQVDDHHWPRVDWTNVEALTDKWQEAELKSWGPDHPLFDSVGGETASEAKEIWKEIVESAAMDFEAELTQRVRKLALSTMKEFTTALLDGEYS